MKRGALVIVLVILFSIAVNALELNLTLDKKEFGANEPLQGFIELKIDQPLEKNNQLIISIGNEASDSKTVDELFSNIPNKQNIPPGFTTLAQSRRDHTFTFTKNETKYIQVDLGLGGACQKQILQSIDGFEMTMVGTQYQSKYPQSVMVDVGLDGGIDYTYKGNPLERYIPLNSSYINPVTAPIKIDAGYGDVFCQEVMLEPTTHYKITSTVQKNVPAAKIIVSIVDDPGYSSFDFRGCLNPPSAENRPVAQCCELQATNSLRDVSCVLPYEVNDKTKSYMCVLAQGEGVEENVFTINADIDQTEKKGFYNGVSSLRDAYIKGEYRDFEKEIKVSKTIRSTADNPEDPYLIAIDDYVNRKDMNVPISINSQTAGNLQVKDVKVKINCEGVITVESFNVVDLGGERIGYNGTLRIPLTNFPKLKSPILVGQNYSVMARLNDISSAQNSFTIVSVPTSVIDASKYTAKINDDIVFGGASSISPEGNQISVYEWDFGDGSAKKTGKFVSYKYNKAGNFTVSLKVTDNKSKSGVGTVTISVEEEKIEELPIKIQNTKDAINKAKEKIEADESLKDIDSLLNLKNKLDDSFANISVTQTEINSELQKANISIDNINRLRLSYESHLDKIPVEITAGKTAFSGKVTDLNDIPEAGRLQVEDIDNFKEKLLTYQLSENVKVDGKVYSVRLRYLSNKVEEFMLVEKTITGGGTIYELIPDGAKVKGVFTPGSQTVQENILKFSGSNKIVYALSDSDVLTATKIKTVLMPLSLSDIEVGTKKKVQFEDTFACGDGICKIGVEDELSCPQDCEKKIPWLIIISLIVIVLLIVFYLNFYHGPGNLQDLLKKKPKVSDYFKDPKTYNSLLTFTKNSLAKGLNENQIRTMLLNKKWKKEQIDFVIQEARKK